uniref:Uncharacterized protein n=1 Tax=Anguilla anguilla TaxID=7936 RepID=A0A0E9XU76_ANGAN
MKPIELSNNRNCFVLCHLSLYHKHQDRVKSLWSPIPQTEKNTTLPKQKGNFRKIGQHFLLCYKERDDIQT